jgi:AcrR family transcriptional regulator
MSNENIMCELFPTDDNSDVAPATHAGGRPRDSSVTPALMQAARELVAKLGYRDVTIQMIAKQAGVGRQTLYRRWPSKADLVLDAFLERASAIGVVPDGPVATMLEAFLRQLFVGLQEDGLAIRSLIASAQDDDAFRETFHARFVKPRDQIIIDILQRAIARGELPGAADPDMMVEMIHGAFWYRLLLGQPLDAAYAGKLTTGVLLPFVK